MGESGQLRSSATPLGPGKERRVVKLFGGEDSQELKTGVSNGQQVEQHLVNDVGSLWKNGGGICMLALNHTFQCCSRFPHLYLLKVFSQLLHLLKAGVQGGEVTGG